MTEAERRDERERIQAGEAPVVVGARSAVFAPVPALGVVCVDEEHDPSYKQESDPRYDARPVAAKRAALEGAVAIFGSATPRPESWARLERLELGRADLGAALPPVRVVDLRREGGYPLSAPLLAELGRVADRGGKAILLLNRRGRRARAALPRVRSDAALPALRRLARPPRRQALRCHHCGHRPPAPTLCPACGSAELARLGAGTERLERELAERLPELERIRLDADTAAADGRYETCARRASRRRTAPSSSARRWWQKGHHFAGVALAAVVDADTGLLLPDFRSEERTFQLLTQLAGRSGRDRPGRVIIQTFNPDARPIALAARHDVRGVPGGRARAPAGARAIRRTAISCGSSSPAPVRPPRWPSSASCAPASTGAVAADLLGPAPLLRLRGRHRAQLIAKATDPRPVASKAARLLEAAARAMRRDDLAASVDVDPQALSA